MGHISYSQDGATALACGIEKRKEAEQSQAEADVQRLKAQWLRDLTASDLGENMGGDWMTAAIRIGDPTLIGQICLMALDQYAERLAVDQVYGYGHAKFKDEELAQEMVSEFVKARAGVTQ